MTKTWKKLLAACLSAAMLLSLAACSKKDDGEENKDPQEDQQQEQQEGIVTPDGTVLDSSWKAIDIDGETVYWDGDFVYEPKNDLDIMNLDFTEFGDDYFTNTYPVTVDSYVLCEGKDTATTVYHIKSENPGPVLYIIGGVHGDEQAGWYTATLMRNVTISCGELYVLCCANQTGAKNHSRMVNGATDLNRVFPGKADGNDAEQLAYAIYSDVEAKNPEFVFDLHEALIYTEGRDCLGSTLIFTDLKGMEDMYFDLLFATEDGTICHNPFEQSGPGPEGSVNATITRNLGIPVITVETLRGFDIHRRVQDQLDIVQFVLDYKGML